MHAYRDCVRFGGNRAFYRGNIHCHSTASDGKLTAEEVARRYRAAGYDFLCFTEHELFTARRVLGVGGLLVIPAVEWSCSAERGEPEQCHHINAIEGTRAMVESAPMGPFRPGDILPRIPFEGRASVDRMLDFLRGHGCIAIYNHPVWSRVRPQDFGPLEGFAGLEVHNYGCELEDFTGFSETYWDNLLSDGARVCAVATDDNHNAKRPDDSFGGWIMVCASELSQDAIVQAILDGDFYASTGPEILRYGILNGAAFVDCSGVSQVNFVSGGGIGSGSTAWSAGGGDDLTHAEHPVSGRESYIRIRCQRADGKVAWSQPLFPEARAR